jgi:hypothetical protein
MEALCSEAGFPSLTSGAICLSSSSHFPLKSYSALSATMLVTRAEDWCVEARNEEEARELLAQGLGHRCRPGARLQSEVESVEG